jgi:hypothetical protein
MRLYCCDRCGDRLPIGPDYKVGTNCADCTAALARFQEEKRLGDERAAARDRAWHYLDNTEDVEDLRLWLKDHVFPILYPE